MTQHTYKVNVVLVLRMFRDHNYSVDDICLRLRYPAEAVEAVLKYHQLIPN